MAEDDRDHSQRTEEPTQKKLDDAVKRGDVVKSADVVSWAVLSTGAALIAFYGSAAAPFAEKLSLLLANAGTYGIDDGSVLALAQDVAASVALFIGVPLLIVAAAAIGANMLQHPFVFTAEKLKWELSKLSPLKGFKRLFSGESLATYAKSVVKLVCIATAAYAVVRPELSGMERLVTLDPAALLAHSGAVSLKMLGAMLAVLGVFAVLDFVWQRSIYMRRMRMSRQEIKDEFKQTEGDPHVRAKIRQIRLDRAKKRMMAAVPTASVVITNPTHYAVALRYESGKMRAPVCVAKGVDALALRIREVAEENEVPIVENPPLARTLHASVEVDSEIPAEHYKAVAQVISYVMRLKGQLRGARRV